MPKIWCDREPGNFPDSEFLQDANGQVAIPHVHQRGKHHFTNGTTVDPVTDPSTNLKILRLHREIDKLMLAGEPDTETQEIQALVWTLHGLAMGLPRENIQDLIEQARSMYDDRIDPEDEGR